MAAPIEIRREKARNCRADGLKLSKRASTRRTPAPAICMSRRLGPGRLPGGAYRLLRRRVDRPVDLLAELGLDRRWIVAPVIQPVADLERQAAVYGGLQADVRRRILGNVRPALELLAQPVDEPVDRGSIRHLGRQREEARRV